MASNERTVFCAGRFDYDTRADFVKTLYDRFPRTLVCANWCSWSREERFLSPEALDLCFQIAPSGLRHEELFHHAGATAYHKEFRVEGAAEEAHDPRALLETLPEELP